MIPLLALLLAAPAAAPCQSPSETLADRMPASTVFLLSVPDLGRVRELQERSPLVRIVRDPEVRAFLGDLGDLSDDTLEVAREMLAEFGVPPEVVDFDAYRALEVGLALQPLPADLATAGVEIPIAFRAGARIAMRDAEVATALFGFVSDSLLTANPPAEVSVVEEGPEGRALVLRFEDQVTTRLVQEGDTLWFDGQGGMPDSVPGLEAAVAYGQLMERVADPDAVVFLFMDFGRIVDLTRESFLPLIEDEPVRDVVADYFTEVLEPLGALALSSGWHEDGGFQHAFLGIRDEDSPLYTLYRADPALLRYTPADQASFSVSGFDLGAWAGTHFRYLQRLLQVPMEADNMGSLGDGLAREYPELYAWLLGEHSAELRAALEGLGRNQVMFGTRRLFGGEFVALMKLDDAVALASVLEQLMPRLKQVFVDAGQGDLLLMRRVRRVSTAPDGSEVVEAGPAYFCLSLPEEEAANPFAFEPCFGVSDDGWLVLAASRDSVRRYLRDGVKPAAPSVLERADLAELLAGTPEDAVVLAYGDLRPLIREALGMALPFAGIAGQSGDLPFELGPPPSPEDFAGYLTPQLAIVQRVPGGLVQERNGYLVAADVFPLLRGGTLLGLALFEAFSEQMVFGEPADDEVEF